MAIDLDAYFARIGYDGPRKPNLKVLRAIHAHHPRAIPFENMDPLRGLPVRLDHDSLQAKLVHGGRGGYCFEQNTLLKAALDQLGFKTTILTARVLWMAPPGAPTPPRTHMLLRVDLRDGAYLADVGFGGHLSASPVSLEPESWQETSAGILRLASTEGDTLTLQLRDERADSWRDVYRFTLEPQQPIDIELANWFTSTHPTSRFVLEPRIQRLTPEGRISLVGRQLTRRFTDGRVEQEQIGEAALMETLQHVFAIDLA